MNVLYVFSRYFVALLFLLSAQQELFSQDIENIAERYPLIPLPISLKPQLGELQITNALKIRLLPYNKETQELAEYIASFLGLQHASILENALGDDKNCITISIDPHGVIPPEGYYLSITPDAISITASTVQGAFWGFQTVKQLIPASFYTSHTSIAIPCVEIYDAPRFTYRGLHLDVSRHFFPVEFIKKYIDLMVSYKFNTFHWHLTDDQGWRVEIKKYPRLQEIAAFRDETFLGHPKTQLFTFLRKFDGRRYGGFYTQEEIKDVVEYARKRHIEIIPEIELPGHSVAVLAAFPELGCSKGPYKTATQWGIMRDVYCAGSEKTFEFLENILEEVISLFPSTYIHIGGDEVLKTRWRNCSKCQERRQAEGLKNEEELQSYFIRRIEQFLNKKNRQIIGWDEILEGGVAPNATVMSWRGVSGGIKAAQQGHNVIMTPNQYLYFDHYQSKSPNEPLAIGGFTNLEKVYLYEPVPKELQPDEAAHILGAQANVWTEFIATSEQVEYMTYPRAIALAEVNWTALTEKNYSQFYKRLTRNLLLLDGLRVHYHPLSSQESTQK